jgi:hypothetical protein
MTPKGAIFVGIVRDGPRRAHRAAEAGTNRDHILSREDVVDGRVRTAG